MAKVEVKPIIGYQIKQLTPNEYLLNLCHKYVCTFITKDRLLELQLDLDNFELIYNKKLKFVLDNETIEIKMARPELFFLSNVLDNDKEHEII